MFGVESRAAAARVRRTGVTSLRILTGCFCRLSVYLYYGNAGGFYYEEEAARLIRERFEDA